MKLNASASVWDVLFLHAVHENSGSFRSAPCYSAPPQEKANYYPKWVVSCIAARGNHKGFWLGTKPANWPVPSIGVNVDRVVDEKIVEHAGAANELGSFFEIIAIKIVGPTD